MKYIINLPKDVEFILSRLKQHNYRAVVVGGCVRDSLLNITPHDWDISTAATPDEVLDVFKHFKTIPTGIQHGTVTVVVNKNMYEITTFRIDGDYTDNRHPESVKFSTHISEDLSRRDFTINAMAYDPEYGLYDFYNGLQDLRNGIIRCVGDPDKRFHEDGLRILRALRFASTYGFKIDESTSKAIHNNHQLLNNISKERINSEFCKMLMGKGILNILLNYSDVICRIIPEMKPCVGFNQNNKWHQYTVYEHIARATDAYKGDDLITRLALFFHDIGKPNSYTEDAEGHGHFYGHPVPSSQITEKVMTDLRFDNKTKEQVVKLVLLHDVRIEPEYNIVRRYLCNCEETQFFRLMDIRLADILGQTEEDRSERIKKRNRIVEIAREVVSQDQVFTLKKLAINGNDLIQHGMHQGRIIGYALNNLYNLVLNESVKNTREDLLNWVQKAYIDNGYLNDESLETR